MSNSTPPSFHLSKAILVSALCAILSGCNASYFSSSRPGDSHIALAKGGGVSSKAVDALDPLRGQRDITFSIGPTGRELFFSASGDGHRDLYSLNLDSLKISRITESSACELNPSVSNDGKILLYAASKDVGTSTHIFKKSFDGGQTQQLTSGDDIYDVSPSFSPDMSQIVFARAHRHRAYSMGGWTWDNWDIYSMAADGSNLQRLTSQNYYLQFSPQFSPDGDEIIFGTGSTANESDLYVFRNMVKNKLTTLTKNRRSYWPNFAPDGNHIVFVTDTDKDFNYEVYLVGKDGSRLKKITSSGSYNTNPHFTPDGKSIIFLSDKKREGRFELWEIQADSNGLRRIADSSLFDNPITWAASHAR